MLTVGSLFAGIGGFDLGLERAGMRSVWQCEIDPYAIRVLEKHWPGVLRVRDVRDVGAGTVPYVDVICGGFPCQDLSIAGRRAGLDGERSGLWGEYARVVGELRPRYVVVENVANLLVRGLGRVLGDLATLGYDAEWDCIPAAAVGAPHLRDRIWLVAYPQRLGRVGRPSLIGRGDHDRPAPEWREGADHVAVGSSPRRTPKDEARFVDEAMRRRHGTSPEALLAGWRGAQRAGWWSAEPDVGRVAHGVPARVDRLRSLGNALVPQIAEWIGRRILEHEAMTPTQAQPRASETPHAASFPQDAQ